MIGLYTGLTGSGKTWSMVHDVYPRWRNGEDIYTNVKLDFEEYDSLTIGERFFKKERRRGALIMIQELSEIMEIRDGVICIDEGHSLFDARNWEKLPDEFSNKLRQQRHHNLDLYVTTQNIRQIDINYRRLVQWWIHTECRWKIGEGRVKIGRFARYQMNTEKITESVDETMVPRSDPDMFYIHWWSKALYDTLYDLGFKKFRSEIIWNYSNNFLEKKQTFLVVPKNLSTQNVLRAIQLSNSLLDPSKLKSLKKH